MKSMKNDTYTAATDPGWPAGANHQKMKVRNLFVSIIALDSLFFLFLNRETLQLIFSTLVFVKSPIRTVSFEVQPEE